MTKRLARREAQETATCNRVSMALVKEGVHADEHAQRDTDGESYGFCPVAAASTLYRFGEVVEVLEPGQTWDPLTGMTPQETAALHRQGICPMD